VGIHYQAETQKSATANKNNKLLAKSTPIEKKFLYILFGLIFFGKHF
jgi:hypothetical protein